MVKSPVEGSTIVMLKMEQPVSSYSDFIRPVCLPTQSNLVKNSTQCNTLGWTKNREFFAFLFFTCDEKKKIKK